MSRLRLSGKQSSRIRVLLGLRTFDLGSGDAGRIRRLVAAAGSHAGDLVPLLGTGDFFSLSAEKSAAAEELIRTILDRGDCLTVSALALDGRALMTLGFGGREIGTVLEKLLSAVLDDPAKNTRETLLSIAQAIKEERYEA